MNLDEQTTDLVRKHLRYSLLVDDMKKALASLTDSRLYLKSFHELTTKLIGSFAIQCAKEIRDELRKSGVSTWVEDQGEIVYAHVAIKGEKERFGVKRSIIDEEIHLMLDDMAEVNRQYQRDKPLKMGIERPDYMKLV